MVQRPAGRMRDRGNGAPAGGLVVRRGIEQRGHEHVAGDAAERIEVQMAHGAGKP